MKRNEERRSFSLFSFLFFRKLHRDARRPFIKVRSFLPGPINLIALEIYGVWHAEEKILRASVFARSIVRYFPLVLLATSAPLRPRNNFVLTPRLSLFLWSVDPLGAFPMCARLAARHLRCIHIYETPNR